MAKPTGIALVTGSGSRRVGSVVADALARRGYAIAVHYRSSAAEAEETVATLRGHGVPVELFRADLTDETAVREMIHAIRERFGRIDVLVNCAAMWQPIPLEQVTAADVRRNFDTNALSTFLCSQHVGLAMVAHPEGGLIVTIGDWAEVRPYLDYAAYFPSKGAVTAMTRSLAVELGTRNPNVRVNCILPGPVMLPPSLTPSEREAAIAGTLVKREGSPANIAATVLSFLDNDFITGVCLPVDGGRTIHAVQD